MTNSNTQSKQTPQTLSLKIL